MQPHRDRDSALGRVFTHDPQRGGVYITHLHGREGSEGQLQRQAAVGRERAGEDVSHPARRRAGQACSSLPTSMYFLEANTYSQVLPFCRPPLRQGDHQPVADRILDDGWHASIMLRSDDLYTCRQVHGIPRTDRRPYYIPNRVGNTCHQPGDSDHLYY